MTSFVRGTALGAGTSLPISIDSIIAFAGSTFTVTGLLVGQTTALVMQYQDDAGPFKTVANVTTTSWSIPNHPSMPVGQHSIAVTDGPDTVTMFYNVGAAYAPGGVTNISAAATAPTIIYLTFLAPDTNQNYTYNVNLGTTGTSGPFPTAYTGLSLSFDSVHGNTNVVTLFGLTASTNYYAQVFAVAPGNLVGAAAVAGPFATGAAGGQTLTVDTISAFVGSSFIVTGTFAGFPSTPTLAWQDDGGTIQTTNVSTNATNSTWSVNHTASWPAIGSHTFTISVSGNSSIFASQTYSVNPAFAPGVVTNFALNFLGGATATSLNVTWHAPDTSQNYTYRAGIGTSTSGPFAYNSPNSSLTSAQFTGLTPSTGYNIEVTAIAPGNILGTPAVSQLFSTTAPILPGQVPPIAVAADIDLGLTVTWSAVTGTGPLTYHIESSTNSTSGFVEQGTTQSLSFAITGLTASTDYFVRVRAISPYGTGAYSAVRGPTTTRNGNVVSTTQIGGTAPTAHAINIVFMAEGYTSTQQSTFNTDCTSIVNGLLADAFYGAHSAQFNFFRININSTESFSGTFGNIKSYFKVVIDTSTEVVTSFDNVIATTTASQQVPAWTAAIVLLNSPSNLRADAPGNLVMLASNEVENYLTLAHELGHAVFGLADEYDLAGGGGTSQANWSGPEPTQPNLTTITDRATTKWASQILAGTLLPTHSNTNGCQFSSQDRTAAPTGVVGLYEGGGYTLCGVYRPENNCRMMTIKYGQPATIVTPFCHVCINAAVAKLNSL